MYHESMSYRNLASTGSIPVIKELDNFLIFTECGSREREAAILQPRQRQRQLQIFVLSSRSREREGKDLKRGRFGREQYNGSRQEKAYLTRDSREWLHGIVRSGVPGSNRVVGSHPPSDEMERISPRIAAPPEPCAGTRIVGDSFSFWPARAAGAIIPSCCNPCNRMVGENFRIGFNQKLDVGR
jgi:hypothetical protein